MKFAPALLLPLSVTLTALVAQSAPTAPTQAKPAPQQTEAAARQLQEAAEQDNLRETFSQILNTVNEAWFGAPYQNVKAMDISGTLVLAIKGGALDAKIEQLTKGAIKSPGIRTGQAVVRLEGTYFANGDHLYNFTGDLGQMRFQRIGEKGYWYIRDQNVYSTSIDSMPKDAPLSYMGWFAGLMSDIKDVYVKGSAFKVSRGRDTTVQGKAVRTIVFDSPTVPYDPKKREQSASDTFSFWKKGHMEVAYEDATKQPLRMEYSNVAQGVEATMSFNYDQKGRIRAIDISNKSKQWEGPGHVTASYNGDGRLTAAEGEWTGPTHKVIFSVNTTWSQEKTTSSLQSAIPPTATKLGREDMELRFAMLFAGNIGDLQRSGFNLMAPKVTPPTPPARLAPAGETGKSE
jgi:hypothetical protein